MRKLRDGREVAPAAEMAEDALAARLLDTGIVAPAPQRVTAPEAMRSMA